MKIIITLPHNRKKKRFFFERLQETRGYSLKKHETAWGLGDVNFDKLFYCFVFS